MDRASHRRDAGLRGDGAPALGRRHLFLGAHSAGLTHYAPSDARSAGLAKKRRTRAPDPDPPPNTPGLSPGTRVRQPLCAQPRATVMRQR
ncbi:hypothetical protein XspCFBP7912_12940 [Xanthomonas sp. CFBP 7912]|nr:hypothetical protein XspCFBP7912_12940 [Xanthomonas sp. CFBP 7912]RJS05875.1 hypothetical protein XnspCFBP7698_06895 [Xanthomonas sp. CFBP 7698]